MQEKLWHQHYDYNVPTSMRFPRIPAQNLLQLAANFYPDKAAINFFGTEMSFWDLRKNAIRLANALASLGIKKGDRVGIHLPNLPQYPVMYYAVLHLGAIVVNFNPLYTPDELKSLVKQTGLKAVLTMDAFIPNIKEVTKAVDIPILIATSLFDYKDGMDSSTSESLKLESGWHHFSQLIENCTNDALPKVDILPEDPAMIQFTGGTTGIPKGATLTHGNVIAAAFTAVTWGAPTADLTPREKRNVMLALPLFHVYANIVGMNWAMLNCATMILVPRFEIDSFMDLLANFDSITFFPAVPTMINAIVHHKKAKELNLAKKINLLNSGGGPIPVELIDEVKNLGITYSEGFGMSETTSLGLSNPNLGLKKNGSIGIPIIGMDVKLVDTATGEKEVPIGEPGELLLKGPLVMKGYWENPEKTAEELKEGWLFSGDIAKMDEDGYFYIVDRKKDMVIAGGYNIYPRDIDEVLYQHPKILDAVSVGIHDAYRGETIKAYIVLKKDETATEKEIISFCKEKLAAYKVPKLVEFRNELPKSAVGKILRKVLREEEAQKKQKEKK
ncbi:MAG: long-chain fatty acid--CoA ligase [Proteobacteria bacterium]|nr:long-chain fatty acid--CoA ligase [Pseudomonadota bacterium]